MTWGYVVVAAVSAVSTVYNAHENKKEGEKNRAAAANQLQFEQNKYNDWQDTYGGIEDNLSEYYAALTPEYYTAVGLENQQQAFQTSQKQLEENLAQRGIVSSGVAASLESQAYLESAQQRATIRRDAPHIVAEERQDFLQVGLGQNPDQSMSNVLAQQAQQAQQSADAANRSTQAAVSTAITTVGTGLADYLNKPSGSTNTPTYSSSAPSHIPQTGGKY